MHIKYRTEGDMKNLIKDIDDDKIDKLNINNSRNEIKLNKGEIDDLDEYNQRYNNYVLKRRGTLKTGIFDEDNDLQNETFDFEDEIL